MAEVRYSIHVGMGETVWFAKQYVTWIWLFWAGTPPQGVLEAWISRFHLSDGVIMSRAWMLGHRATTGVHIVNKWFLVDSILHWSEQVIDIFFTAWSTEGSKPMGESELERLYPELVTQSRPEVNVTSFTRKTTATYPEAIEVLHSFPFCMPIKSWWTTIRSWTILLEWLVKKIYCIKK